MQTAEIDRYVATLGSGAAAARVRAAWSLGEGCFVEERVYRALERSLRDPDPDLRGTAAEALGRISSRRPAALDAVLRYVEQEPEPFVRARAVYGIGRSGSSGGPAVPLLLRLAATDATHAYDTALWALGEIGLYADTVIPVLIAGLGKPHSDQRWVAAKALGRFGSQAHSAVPVLLEMLGDRHPFVSETAARALGEIAPGQTVEGHGRGAPPPASHVSGLLQSATAGNEPATRVDAVFRIGELGPGAVEAVPNLVDLLDTAEGQLRLAAIGALGKVGVASPAAAAALSSVLGSADSTLLGAIDWALGLVGPAAEGAIPLVARQLEDYPEDLHMHLEIRYHAVWALARLDARGQRVLPYLLRSLRDPDSDVRAIAAENLGWIPGPLPEVMGELDRLSDDVHEIVRQRAAWAMQRLAS